MLFYQKPRHRDAVSLPPAHHGDDLQAGGGKALRVPCDPTLCGLSPSRQQESIFAPGVKITEAQVEADYRVIPQGDRSRKQRSDEDAGIRVFPRRTKWTPTDRLAFIGDPPLFMPEANSVKISVTFTWDIPEGERLFRAWSKYYSNVQIGGPAFGDTGGEFTPGQFVKEGVAITSRGCPKSCTFCLVSKREGKIRELEIKDGWNLIDNNLLACSRPHIEAVFEMLWHQPQPADFTGGLDKDFLRPWHVDLLKSIRLNRAWFACDSIRDFPALERAAVLLAGISMAKKYCYVLIGYGQDTPEEAEARLMRVFTLGFMPFAMLYRGTDVIRRMHPDPVWRALSKKWCRPAGYKAFMKGLQLDNSMAVLKGDFLEQTPADRP